MFSVETQCVIREVGAAFFKYYIEDYYAASSCIRKVLRPVGRLKIFMVFHCLRANAEYVQIFHFAVHPYHAAVKVKK
jgi:hypothetical protein